MADALATASQSELAEIDDIAKTIEKTKKICKKVEQSNDENGKKIVTVLEEIVEKLDIAICESIILEETKTSVPSLAEGNEMEFIIHKAVKVKSASADDLFQAIPGKMNYKNCVEIQVKND